MDEITRELFQQPNVIVVGGASHRVKKVVGGVTTDRDCIMVGVSTKIPRVALSKQEIIPARVYLAGREVETDVVDFGGKIYALDAAPDHKARYRPMPGGVSIGDMSGTGTGAGIVRKNGVRYVLSNNHVLGKKNQAKVGDVFYQPGFVDGGTVEDGIVTFAELVRIWWKGEEPAPEPPPPSDCPIAGFVVSGCNWVAGALGRKTRLPHAVVPGKPLATPINKVDAAIARPIRDEDCIEEILEIGLPGKVVDAVINMGIKKSGRSSGLNFDEILSDDATTEVNYNPEVAILEDQLITKKQMLISGDSGSRIFVNAVTNEVVGLGFAGSANYAVLNKFTNVIEALNLDK